MQWGALLLTAWLALVPTPEPWTADDTIAALTNTNAPPVVWCVVRLESGYEPYAVGAAGEQGPIQLLPSWRGGGQWNDYHEGPWVPLDPVYRSVNDPFLAVRYLMYWGETHGWTYWPWSAWRYC